MKRQNSRNFFNKFSDNSSKRRDDLTGLNKKVNQPENRGILDFAKQMINESKRAIQETNLRIEETKRLMK